MGHPESFTYKLPDNMDTMEGALVEPAAVGMHAMLADVKPGKKIIILGAGCIGLMTLQACKCLGATEIAVVDAGKRLAMAEQLVRQWLLTAQKKTLLHAVSNLPKTWAQILFSKQRVLAVTVKQAPYLVMRGGKIMYRLVRNGDSGNQFPQNQSRSHYPDGIPLRQSLSGHD